MPKLSELEVGSNKKPASSRSAFLGTEEAQGFDDLRAYVLAQEKEKKEEERERKLDLGLSPEDEKPGFLKKTFRKLSHADHEGGRSYKDPEHGKAVYRSQDDEDGDIAEETATTS